jgi:hypothetical protein
MAKAKSFEFQRSKAGGFGNFDRQMSALILLGVLVLLAGERSVVVLVPAAALVWYALSPKLRTGRN